MTAPCHGATVRQNAIQVILTQTFSDVCLTDNPLAGSGNIYMAPGRIGCVAMATTERQGLSMTMIGGVVLALIGVGVLIMMFSDMGLAQTFCGVYSGIGTVFPGDSPPPDKCGSGDGRTYTEQECPDDPNSCALSFAAAISQCWEQYQGYMTEEELCEGWNMGDIGDDSVDSIDDSDIITALEENNICNEQIQCSSEVEIAPDEINEGQFVVIEYRSSGTDERIVVE